MKKFLVLLLCLSSFSFGHEIVCSIKMMYHPARTIPTCTFDLIFVAKKVANNPYTSWELPVTVQYTLATQYVKEQGYVIVSDMHGLEWQGFLTVRPRLKNIRGLDSASTDFKFWINFHNDEPSGKILLGQQACVWVDNPKDPVPIDTNKASVRPVGARRSIEASIKIPMCDLSGRKLSTRKPSCYISSGKVFIKP